MNKILFKKLQTNIAYAAVRYAMSSVTELGMCKVLRGQRK